MALGITTQEAWSERSSLGWISRPPEDPGIYVLSSRGLDPRLAKIYRIEGGALWMKIVGHQPTPIHQVFNWWWWPVPINLPCLPTDDWTF